MNTTEARHNTTTRTSRANTFDLATDSITQAKALCELLHDQVCELEGSECAAPLWFLTCIESLRKRLEHADGFAFGIDAAGLRDAVGSARGQAELLATSLEAALVASRPDDGCVDTLRLPRDTIRAVLGSIDRDLDSACQLAQGFPADSAITTH